MTRDKLVYRRLNIKGIMEPELEWYSYHYGFGFEELYLFISFQSAGLGRVCVCVCVFSFTAELRGGYRGFPHTPCLNTAPQQPPWMAPLLQLTGYMRSSLPRVPS